MTNIIFIIDKTLLKDDNMKKILKLIVKGNQYIVANNSSDIDHNIKWCDLFVVVGSSKKKYHDLLLKYHHDKNIDYYYDSGIKDFGETMFNFENHISSTYTDDLVKKRKLADRKKLAYGGAVETKRKRKKK